MDECDDFKTLFLTCDVCPRFSETSACFISDLSDFWPQTDFKLCHRARTELSQTVPCDQARLRGRNLLGDPGPARPLAGPAVFFRDRLSKQKA